MDFNIDLIVSKDLDGNYFIKKEDLPIYNQFSSIKFQIKKSLFEDGKKAGVPLTVLAKIIQLYSFDIDFQRDIKKGNELEVLYESFYNEKREAKSYGKIYYVNLFLDKNELEYFLFKTNEGFYDYYNIL